MAKIPMAELGVGQGTHSGLAEGLASSASSGGRSASERMVGAIAGTLGTFSGEVGELDTAKRRIEIERLKAEQRELEKQMAVKQKLVDTSNIGRLSSEFEMNLYKLEDSMHQEFAENPEQALEEYRKRAYELSPQTVKRGANVSVQQGVTQSNESAISSGVGRMHTWVSQTQSDQIKANLVEATNYFANSAVELSSPEAVELKFLEFARKQAPNFAVVYGKEAANKMTEARSDAFYAWAKRYTYEHPIEYLAGVEKNNLLRGSLDEKKTAELYSNARTSRNQLGYKRTNDLLIEGVQRDVPVAKALVAGQLRPDDLLEQRKMYQKQKESILLSSDPDDIKQAQIKIVNRYLEILDATEEVVRKGTPTQLLPGDSLPEEVMAEYKALFGKDTRKRKRSQKLDDLLTLKADVVKLLARENISSAQGMLMYKTIGEAMERAAKKARGDTPSWFTPDDPMELAMGEMETWFETNKPKATEAEKNQAYLRFMALRDQAKGEREELGEEEAQDLARKACYVYYGLVPPKTKKPAGGRP